MAQTDSADSDLFSLDSLLNMRISSVSKYEQTTAEAPASVTIIAREDIQNYGYADLMELLTTVRDLYIGNDRNFGYLGIRGFSRPTDFNNRIAVMVNGVLLNENIWGSGPIGSEFQGLNIDDVERVEVIRGPASALYGNYPMLGMINIITLTGKTSDGLVVSAEQGSYGKWQGSASSGTITKKGIGLHLGGRVGTLAGQRLYYEEFDDSSSDGIADHRDGSTYTGFHGQITYKGWSFKNFFTWRNTGIPTGSYGTLFNSPKARIQDTFGNGELSYSREIGRRSTLQARTWVSGFSESGNYPYDSADGGIQGEHTHGMWAGLEGRWRLDIRANHRLLVGAEVQRHFWVQYQLSYDGVEALNGNYPFTTAGVYVQDEFQPLKKLSVTAGLRYDRLRLGRNALMPRLALNYFVGKAGVAKLLYGEAFRAPNVYESTVGTDGYILPNDQLKPERIRSLEFLFEQRISRHFLATGSLFANGIYNIIEETSNAAGELQFANADRAGGYGASAQLDGRLPVGIHFYTSYSYTEMVHIANRAALTNSPRHLVKGGVSVKFLRHFRVSPEFWAESGRLTVYETMTDPFVVANVNLAFMPALRGKSSFLNRFQLAFKLRNIFDTDYRYPGGFEHLQPAIQQNGRNYSLKLQVQLF